MGTIKISGNAIRYTLIPELMIKDHLSAAPGDFVKVLLAVYYLHQSGSGLSTEAASHICGLPEDSVMAAFEYWDKVKVLTIAAMDHNGNIHTIFNDLGSGTSRGEMGEAVKWAAPSGYANEDQEGKSLRELFDVIEMINGSPLSPSLLRFIQSLRADFQFDDEVAVLLFSHCQSKGNTSVPYMEKVALNWKDKAVHTAEEANAMVRQFEDKWTKYRDLFKFMGNDPSKISVPQEKQLDKWYDAYGFSHEVIKQAAERCISQLGKAEMNYIEGILDNWKSLDIKTLADIEQKDSKRSKKTWSKKGKPDTTSFNNYNQRSYDYENLEKKLLGWDDNEE